MILLSANRVKKSIIQPNPLMNIIRHGYAPESLTLVAGFIYNQRNKCLVRQKTPWCKIIWCKSVVSDVPHWVYFTVSAVTIPLAFCITHVTFVTKKCLRISVVNAYNWDNFVVISTGVLNYWLLFSNDKFVVVYFSKWDTHLLIS